MKPLLVAGLVRCGSVAGLRMVALVRLVAGFLVLVGLCRPMGVPTIGARRMIPRQWFSALRRGGCFTSEDCASGECCTRPIASQNRFCLPLADIGQACGVFRTGASIANQLAETSACPCRPSLTCRARSRHFFGLCSVAPAPATTTRPPPVQLALSYRQLIFESAARYRPVKSIRT